MGDSDLLKNELVSIIMPAYNAERFIGDSIKSVLSQTYSNFELIILDDCSTDSTEKIVQSYNDERVKYHRNSKNLGAALSRNRGIELSNGRYIAFLDSDDMWKEKKLQRQIKLLSNTNYVMSYAGLEIIDEDGKFIKSQSVPKHMNYKMLLRNTAIATSSVVLDRQKITGKIAMPDRKTGEDYSLWLKILKRYGNAVADPKYDLVYRKVTNSLSSHRLDSFGDLWYAQHIENGIAIPVFLVNYFWFAIRAVKKHFF